MKSKHSFIVILAAVLISACAAKQNPVQSAVDTTGYSKLDSLVMPAGFNDSLDGKAIHLYTMKNASGFTVKVTNYGARIVSVLMPDAKGHYADITLGYSTSKEYLRDRMFLGCIVGRYANRIAKGTFSLDGKTYQLSINDGPNSLHGGRKGFGQVVWDGEQNGNEVIFHYISNDMEEGYPGKLDVTVRYTLSDSNTLAIAYKATTDKKTVLNLTNHAYFNLSGEGSGTILNQLVTIPAAKYLPVDKTLIPTGKEEDVQGTPMDFNTATAIGARINEQFPQLLAGKGYDHCWVLKKDGKEDALSLAVKVEDPQSGRIMELWTTEPGVQFYSGNFMNGMVKGKSGKAYNFREGFAFEPEHFPDSPNQKNFPNTVLLPGQEYNQLSVFHFYNKK